MSSKAYKSYKDIPPSKKGAYTSTFSCFRCGDYKPIKGRSGYKAADGRMRYFCSDCKTDKKEHKSEG